MTELGKFELEAALTFSETDHKAHVDLYRGYDLMAAGIDDIPIRPCLYCLDDEELYPTHHEEEPGERIHFIACMNCGAAGPIGRLQSQALLNWNAALPRLVQAIKENRLPKSPRPPKPLAH